MMLLRLQETRSGKLSARNKERHKSREKALLAWYVEKTDKDCNPKGAREIWLVTGINCLIPFKKLVMNPKEMMTDWPKLQTPSTVLLLD